MVNASFQKMIAGMLSAVLMTTPAIAELDLSDKTRALLDQVPMIAANRVDLESFSDGAVCGPAKPFNQCFKAYERVSGEGGENPTEILEIGYWNNNALWRGFSFENRKYEGYYFDGEFYGKSCTKQEVSG